MRQTQRLGRPGIGFGVGAGTFVGLAIMAVPLEAIGLALALVALIALAYTLRYRSDRGAYDGLTTRDGLAHRAHDSDTRGAGDRAFTFARLAYYLGIFTLAALAIRPLASITVSDWMFFASLFLAVVAVLATREQLGLGLGRPILIGSALFAVGGLLSSIQAASPIGSVAVVARVMYLTIVWFWLGTAVLRRQQDVRMAVRLWVLSAAASGIAAFIQLRGFDVVHLTPFSALRMTGLAEHVNDLGGITSIALVPALALGVASKTVRGRLFSYGCVLALVAGLILSGSLSGMATGAVAVLVWTAVVSRRQLSALVMFCSLAVAVLGIIAYQAAQGLPSPLERFNQATFSPSDPNATFWSRINTDQVAWEAIQRSPILGVGLDPNSGLTSTGFQVHNALLGAWYEAGLLGVAGLILVFIGVLRIGRSPLVYAATQEGWELAAALLISFLAFLAYGMAAPILYQRYGWVSAAMLIALRAREGQSRVAAPARHRETSPAGASA